ncbi:MAG: polysaccharide biosynthesis/export family protein [Acidobacteriia bacterium]|nr:polysaccharide biosynthesis/export family protein [Terriglobia bacterium]
MLRPVEVCRVSSVLSALILASGLVLGQGAKPANPSTPAPNVAGSTEAVKVPSTVSADTVGLPIDPKIYVIGPEDILRISVWRENDLSGIKGVRPDGKITMPLIGDLQASGLTPERLTAQLKQALSEFVKQPEITVEIIQVNSKNYSITGGVNRPGRYPLVITKTVFEAVNDAGGFREFANEKDIVILRKDGTRLHFNYREFVKGKHADKNIVLENGDTILVKE